MKNLLLQEMRTHSDMINNTWKHMCCYEVSGPYSKNLLGMSHQNGKNYGYCGGDLVHCSNTLKKKAASSIDMLAIFTILS